MQTAILMLMLGATPQSWDFKTGDKPNVSVGNVDGSIAVEGGIRDDVAVEASFAGGEDSGWIVEAHADGSKVKVQACCGSCGHSQRSCRGGKVNLVLKIPQASKLEVSGVSCEIAVKGVTGPEKLNTVSGRLESSGSASTVHIRSVSGDVTLAPQQIGETDAHTVSGNVRVKLPANADAKIHLSTVSGLLDGQKVGIGSAEKSFGKGTVAVNVKTVSGSVNAEPSH